MSVSQANNPNQIWQRLQVAAASLSKADRNAVRRQRVENLRDSYDAAGGSSRLAPSERLTLDRRAMARASRDWVQENSQRMTQGLASCRTSPQGSNCRDGRALRAVQQAAERYMTFSPE